MSTTEFDSDELEDEFEEEAMELAPFFARGGAVKFGRPSRARPWARRVAFPVDFGDELEEQLMELEPLFPRGGLITHPYGNEKWGQAFNTTTWAMPEFEGEPCNQIWAVPEFAQGSSKLQLFQKKHINDFMTKIARSLLPKLKGSEKKNIDFEFDLEGHVDKDTDPKEYGTLDEDRAQAVAQEIGKSSSQTLFDIFFYQLAGKNIPGMGVKVGSVTGAGSTRPFSATNKKLNRRVVVCARWTIKPAL
jgi:hypothetical protein